MNVGMMFVAGRVAKIENMNLFTEEEMKIIRGRAFVSCVEEFEVCLSADAVAKLFHRSPTTIRNWCSKNMIKHYISQGHYYEIPLSTVVDLKQTNGKVNEMLPLDIKKVDF